MQNKSGIAGILSIIAGALGICSLAWAWYASHLVRYMVEALSYEPVPETFFRLMTAQYFIMGGIGTTLGILGILGGIYALRKRRWNWALAGAISGVLIFFPVGIAAIILLSMGRDEFQ